MNDDCLKSDNFACEIIIIPHVRLSVSSVSEVLFKTRA